MKAQSCKAEDRGQMTEEMTEFGSGTMRKWEREMKAQSSKQKTGEMTEGRGQNSEVGIRNAEVES